MPTNPYTPDEHAVIVRLNAYRNAAYHVRTAIWDASDLGFHPTVIAAEAGITQAGVTLILAKYDPRLSRP